MYNARIAFCGALLLLVAVTNAGSTKCSRLIDGVTRPRSAAEGKYHFFMTLFNRSELVTEYMPNTRYSVVLQADNQATDQMPRKFTRFLISAETENVNGTVGAFDLQDDGLSKFADNCANAVMETSMVRKDEVSVIWTSPAEGSGCVLLRATVLETPDTWYMDDPELIRNMCQDSKAEADDQGPVLEECCACTEAKYEVTFEGLWSRNTHPKDFPSKGWLIRFSDVIGASHSDDYHFWRYNEVASTGLKQVAEFGATRMLESELKAQSENIRTIIKARGISYPNVTGKTFAVFRVDRKHHLMSLVSMIDPSPDWIVGVSGLELCLTNCSWIEHKELNLYPYDAGTDDGITYLSPDSPLEEPEVIRRITSTFPNDSRSPFYDPLGLDMKPFAKLYLNRQRLYEKTCENKTVNPADAEACKRNSTWAEWSGCSATCGRGFQLRQRRFLNEAVASECNGIVPLTERRNCYNMQRPSCPGTSRYGNILDTEKCELSSWSQWSSCSSTCGEGSITQNRFFVHKKFRKQCMAVPDGPVLQQSIDCGNDPCEGEDEEVRDETNEFQEKDYLTDKVNATTEMKQEWLKKCPADRYTEWAIWSPCSSTCGSGLKVRSRLLKNSDSWTGLGKDDHECRTQQAECTAEIPSCDFTKDEAEKICSEPMEKGICNGNVIRAYFDKQTGECRMFSYTGCNGNRNNFQTAQDCYYVCGKFQKRDFKGFQSSSQIMESSEYNKVDCQVSEWSEWSYCGNCRGYTVRTRHVTVAAKGGGKPCPKKLSRKKKCHKAPQCSSSQGDRTGHRYYRDRNTGNDQEISVIDCKVTKWSTWSKCSATCGESLRTRVRSVMVEPRGLWAKLCPPLAEFKKCPRVDCPQ